MKNIYQHFREDEQSFIEQVLDWIAQVNTQYAPYLTNFLNPRQHFIAESIIGQYEDVNYKSFGGFEGAEQKRILIYPPYFEPEETDFEIVLLEISYPTKFAELSHGAIMGSVLGTGFSRANLGDIITDGIRWQFYLDEKMVGFVKQNMDRVGNINIQLDDKNLNERIESLNKWEIEEIIVASLRIDLVLAKALNLSRNRTKEMINDRKIKINWVEIERPDLEVEEHDIISIRGYGRVQIKQRLGTTRKDNLIIEIGIISRNS